MLLSKRRILLLAAVSICLVLINIILFFSSAGPFQSSVELNEHSEPRDLQGSCNNDLCTEVKEGMLNVHLVAHSHMDVGWRKTADQYYIGARDKNDVYKGKDCVRCILNSTIRELLLNPRRKFIFVELAFFSRFWQEIDKKARQDIRKLIRRRQLEIAMDGWVMSDAAVTYYNDFIDQLTLGLDYLERILGRCSHSKVAWQIDTFGHSKQIATLFAKMGFDGLFIGRMDYQDHQMSRLKKRLEFLWKTTEILPADTGYLFTHVLFDGYYSPEGFVFDHEVKESDFEQLLNGLFLENAEAWRKAYRTQHVLIPMGGDFAYENAKVWFDAIDLLIRKNNLKSDKSKVNLLYSTPSCYLHHVHKTGQRFPARSDDLLPYVLDGTTYWTGFFTSRPGLKLLVKRAGAILQACKQLGILTRLTNAFDRTNVLRKAMAVMQHHDAITGTQTADVANDYKKMLSEGIAQCQSVMAEAFTKLLVAQNRSVKPLNFQFCPKLNISACSVTEVLGQMRVFVYNPLSRPVTTWVRLPVISNKVTVRDSQNLVVIPSQLMPVPEKIKAIDERMGAMSDTEIIWRAKLPAMGFTSFYLTLSRNENLMNFKISETDLTIENQHLRVKFDAYTARMTQLTNLRLKKTIRLHQDIVYYVTPKRRTETRRPSGSYAFVPSEESPRKIKHSFRVHVRVYRSALVQEVHQTFSPWAFQVVRLYNDSRYLDIQWMVGPIPTEDRVGKEVVSLFSTDLKTNGIFYTEAHGREVQERKLKDRSAMNLTVSDPVSGNYYPVTSRIFIQDKKRNLQLTVIPDRPQGGSSLHDGSLELLIHRRLITNDDFGLLETLDEPAQSGYAGISYSGRHLLFLNSLDTSAKLTKDLALQVHLSPSITFLHLMPNLPPLFPHNFQRTFLGYALPWMVQVLTLDYTGSGQKGVYLLRLEHLGVKRDTPEKVEIQGLFSPLFIKKVEEVSLGGDRSPDKVHRLKWTSDDNIVNSDSIESPDYQENLMPPYFVTLRYMEIRTFKILVTKPAHSSFSLA